MPTRWNSPTSIDGNRRAPGRHCRSKSDHALSWARMIPATVEGVKDEGSGLIVLEPLYLFMGGEEVELTITLRMEVCPFSAFPFLLLDEVRNSGHCPPCFPFCLVWTVLQRWGRGPAKGQREVPGTARSKSAAPIAGIAQDEY